MTDENPAAKFSNNALAIFVSLIMFIPVYLVFVNSLKTKAEASSMGAELPDVFQWSNFATVIEKGKLLTAFGNSVLYAVGRDGDRHHRFGPGGLRALAQPHPLQPRAFISSSSWASPCRPILSPSPR